MSAPEALKLSPLSLAALRVKQLRASRQDTRAAEDQLLALAQPMIKGEARRWATSAGAVQFEDLTQAASLAVHLAVDTWAGKVPFKVHARRKVARALRELVGSQGRAVSPSDGVRRGRRGLKVWACDVLSTDAHEGARAELEAIEQPEDDSEQPTALDAETVREVLELLPSLYRETLIASFGLDGQEPLAQRGVAARIGKKRSQVERTLALALKAARVLAGR